MNLKDNIICMFREEYKRSTEDYNFKSYFYRYIGTEDKREYNDIIRTLLEKCKAKENYCIIFDGEIPLSGEIELIKYILDELSEIDINNLEYEDIKIFKNADINNRFLKALSYSTKLAIRNEKFFNESIRNNFITELIIWTYKWVINIRFEQDIIPKCIYYGDIKRHEIYFLILLHKMGFDVIYINPLREEYWDEIDCDNNSKLIIEDERIDILSLKERAKEGEVIEEYKTITKQLENEIDSEIFEGTGIYKKWQFKSGYTKGILMDSTLEDIFSYWKQDAKIREGFKVEGKTVSVPCMFFKIDGVMEDIFEYRNLVKFCIESEKVCFMHNNRSIFTFQEDKFKDFKLDDIKLENGEIDIEKIKKLSFYTLSKYNKDLQNFMLKKLVELLKLNRLFNKELDDYIKLRAFITIMSLRDEVIELIDGFDFTANIPKIIFYAENINEVAEVIQYAMAYLHIIGFDIIIFNPSNRCSVNEFLSPSIMNNIRLDKTELNLDYGKLITMKKSIFSRFRK